MAIALYAHFPYCLAKCRYCDFYSVPVGSQDTRGFFLALRRELILYAQKLPADQRRLHSLYLGGGTPTCLPAAELAGFLADCRRLFDWLPGAEVTIEANPGTVDPPKLEQLLAAGVNRLSLGVQAFNDRLLRRLGRVHTAAEAAAACQLAKRAGLDNVNLDLMYGLPGQTVADWTATLEQAVALEPSHISAYSLKVEPGTPFGELADRGELVLPGEDEEAAMYEQVIGQMAANGFIHYEISNFARPGRESRHNLTYWLNQEYLGLGPAAHSYLDRTRQSNVADIQLYRQDLDAGRLPVCEREVITPELERAETMFLGLRLLKGVSRSGWRQRFGVTVEEAYPGVVERLVEQGLLSSRGDRIALTRRGLFLANQVFAEFLP